MEAPTGQQLYFQVLRPGDDAAGGGDARQIIPVQAFQLQDGASLEAATSSLASAGREDDKLRRRVMRLCMFSAAFFVVHALVNTFVNLAMFEDVLRVAHEVKDVPVPSFFLIAVGSLKTMFIVLTSALLVQACGYYGAKHGQVGGPPLAKELVRCDPYQCMPMGNLTKRELVVDCLAAGAWDGRYVRRFGPQPQYPGDCQAALLLECESHAAGGGSAAAKQQHGDPPPYRLEDVLGSCKINQKEVTDLHTAAVMLPELTPQVIVWLYVKVALLLPVLLIGCLGCCWGTAMYNKASNSSSGLVGLPSQTQIVLQPVLGSLVAAGQPRDATMVQPLMMCPRSEAPL